MSVQITGTSGTVKYNNTVTEKQTVYTRREVSCSRLDDKFELLSNDYREEFNFDQVTNPVAATPALLLDAINALI